MRWYSPLSRRWFRRWLQLKPECQWQFPTPTSTSCRTAPCDNFTNQTTTEGLENVTDYSGDIAKLSTPSKSEKHKSKRETNFTIDKGTQQGLRRDIAHLRIHSPKLSMIPRFCKKQIKQSKRDYSAGLQQTVCLCSTRGERGGAKLRRTNYRPLRVHLVYRGCVGEQPKTTKAHKQGVQWGEAQKRAEALESLSG